MLSVALAYAAGVALSLRDDAVGMGVTESVALVAFVGAVALAPRSTPFLLALSLAGAWGTPGTAGCRMLLETRTAWTGFALDSSERSGAGRARRFRLWGEGRCGRDVAVYGVPGNAPAGLWIRATGVWEEAFLPGAPARFVAHEVEPVGEPSPLAAPGARLARVRAALEADVEQLLPERAPLLHAFLFARRGELPSEVRNGFTRTGTAHLLAISGFHIGVVASVVFAVASLLGLGTAQRALVSAGFCWVYVAGLGFPRPAVRATVLLTAVGCSRLLGRPSRSPGVLSSALLAFLIADPAGFRSAGTQLTFAATAGILLLTRPVDRLLGELVPSRFMPGPLRRSVAVSVAATLPTMPLIGWHFGEISWMSVPSTLLLTPAVSLSVTGGVLMLTTARALPPMAEALAGGVDIALLSVERILVLLGTVPSPSFVVSRSESVGLAVGLIAGLGWARFRPGGKTERIRAARTLSLLLAGLVLGPSGTALAGRGRLEIHMVDVGQGDATLIKSPGGRWMLLDAGPRTESFDAGARRVLPHLRATGIERIDRLVLTHADLDHIGGAPAVLAGVDVGRVSDPGDAKGSQAYVDVLRAALVSQVPWTTLTVGDDWNWDGVDVRVLAPEEATGEGPSNDRSIVLLLRFGEFEILLTGDASTSVEESILRELPDDLEVLKVGHHGSATSTGSELLERTRPQLSVISVGRRNRYGHPAPAVVDRLRRGGARILRTDVNGTVRIFASDSGRFQVLTQRGVDPGRVRAPTPAPDR